MYKRMTALLLVLTLLPLLAWGETPDDLPVMAGYEEKDTFRDWTNNLFFKRMEERSGQAFVYQQYLSWEDWQKAKNAMTAREAPLPQVLFKASLSPAETMEWLDKGLLVDLAPLLEAHAPNLWKLLEDHPDVRAAITLPDGRVGALPYINLAPTQNALWINTNWLTTLKLDMPETPEAFQQVLHAFLEQDPNRNARRDEKPFSFIGPYDLKYLAQGFGLIANDFNMFERQGQAVFMPGEPSFKDYIRWLAELWQQGLLDRDGFYSPDSLRQMRDAKAAQVHGAFLAPLPSAFLPVEWAQDYQVVLPLEYQGQRVWRDVAGRVTPGTFALTAACQEPEAMLNWVDYLYTEEGSILATNGQEGVDYLVDGDGTWRMTDSAQQQGFLVESTIATGAVPPGVSNHAFQVRSSQPLVGYVTRELEKLQPFVKEPFPPFSLTREQEAYIAPLQAALGRYVDESIARWALGEWETTEEQFQAFYQQLEVLGVAEFTAFWQTVLDQNT